MVTYPPGELVPQPSLSLPSPFKKHLFYRLSSWGGLGEGGLISALTCGARRLKMRHVHFLQHRLPFWQAGFRLAPQVLPYPPLVLGAFSVTLLVYGRSLLSPFFKSARSPSQPPVQGFPDRADHPPTLSGVPHSCTSSSLNVTLKPVATARSRYNRYNPHSPHKLPSHYTPADSYNHTILHTWYT